jgi:Protein of unknown function (DUF3293)
MAAEPGAWSAYVSAVMRIEAPGGVFWVRPAPPASTTGEYPDPQGRPMYVLTAHNPGGRVAPDAANALAEKRLTAELERRGLAWWPAAGGEFGQDAIFVLTPADRRIVACTGKRVTVTGWSSEPDIDQRRSR